MDSIRLVGSVATLVVLGVMAYRRMGARAEMAGGMSERRASFIVAKPADEVYQRAKIFGSDSVLCTASDDALRRLTFQTGNFTFPVVIRPEGKATIVEVGCLRQDGKFAPLDDLHQTFIDAMRQHLLSETGSA